VRRAATIFLCSAFVCASAAASDWRDKVPPNARLRANPYADEPSAAQAGGKLFVRYCAPCHRARRSGKWRAPDLSSPVVQKSPPGELFWILRNGMVRQGMPSWAHLPDEQRWQIVTWLQTRSRE
jgi:mono/diheme cytochrome c family protein